MIINNVSNTEFDSMEINSLELLIKWIIQVVFISLLMFVTRRLIVWFEEIKQRKYYQEKYELIFQACFDDLSKNLCCIIFIVIIGLAVFITYSDLSFLECIFYGICFNLLEWIRVSWGYEDAEINECQKNEESIGAAWAQASYTSYYQVVFDDIREKIMSYETKNEVYFPCKKLIIIVPLSCNVKKGLDDQDAKIKAHGFIVREHDQGANINRIYKNQVYEIETGNGPIYFVGEYPSPLNNLWKLKTPRGGMSEEHCKYHRDCFIKTLKELVRDCPCILLEYPDADDSIKPQPLHELILSELDIEF